MNTPSIASNVTNFLTIVIGVAFLGVSTVGIVSPVKAHVPANTAISTSTAR